MDEYDQYLADLEYENYIRQAQAEDVSRAMSRSGAPATQSDSGFGPDYSQSVGANAWRGVTDAPEAAFNMVGDAYNFANPLADGGRGGPIDTIRNAGAEKTVETVGTLAAGSAGAMYGAPWGAAWGSTLGPLGTIAGGVAGGAVGFGLGALGFDVVSDAATEGVGAVTGREDMRGYIQPADQYAKDFAYNVGQGTVMGGATEAVRAIPRVRRLAAPFTQDGADARVAAHLEKLEPGLAGQIDTAMPFGPQQDPFALNKSLGELVDSDVLRNAQRTLARTGPQEYGRAAEANRMRNDVQLKYLEGIDDSTMGAADVQTAIRDAVEQKTAAGQRGLAAAEDSVNAAVGDLPAPIPVTEAGALMREGAMNTNDAYRTAATNKFENTGNGIVDPAPAQAVIQDVMPRYFREVGAQPNAQLVKLVEDLSREADVSGLLGADGQPIVRPATYSLRDIQAIRSDALKIAKSSDPRTKAIALQISDALLQAGDDAVKAGNVLPEHAANWREGIAIRREKGAIFENSALPTKSVISRQPFGDFKVPESAVPSKYFRPGERGTREAVRNYKQAIGASEQALEPLYRYATDSFKDYVVKDGVVDAKKARAWLDRHRGALEEMPDLKAQLSDVHTRQQFLNEKYGDLKRSQAEVEKGALKQFLQVDPEQAIGAMLSGKDMVKRTSSTVQYLKANDPDALAGLRRGVIDHLKAKSFVDSGKVPTSEAAMPGGPQFDGTVKNAVLANEWKRIEPALKRSGLFTKSQLDAFDYLYKDKMSQMSVEKAKMPDGSDTVQNASTLAALSRAAGRGFLRNLPFGRYIQFLEPVLKAIPEGRFQATLEEALLNPRIARDLMAKATAKNFTRSAEQIFKEDIAKAFGTQVSPTQALVGAAKVAAPFAGTVAATPQKPDKKYVPRQQAVTARKSFPTPQELLRPAAPGSLKKTNVSNLVAQQSPETRARISVESSGDPWAVSPKGAQGLSQLMPATAQEIATKLGETYMPLRPGMTEQQQAESIAQNIRFGEYYYNQQLKNFKDPILARAAYNAGPGRVAEAIAMAGTSRDTNRVLSALPRGVQKETIPYVRRITARTTQEG